MKTVKRVLTIAMCAALMLTSAPLSGFVGLDLPSLFDFSFSFNAQGMEAPDVTEWSTEESYEDWTGEPTTVPVTYPPEIYTEPPVEEPTTQAPVIEEDTTAEESSDYVPSVDYSSTCGDNLTWSLDTSTGVLNITGTGAMDNYAYEPDVPWFSYRDYIKAISIASGATTIGDYAFYGCDNITRIVIPDSIITIGKFAFHSCTNLTSVTIGSSVKTIRESAFGYCCSLTNVTIPDSVNSIGSFVFSSCQKLASITVSANNKYYSSDSYGVLFNKDKTTLIQYPIGKTGTSYTIPDSVTTIDDWAFAYCTSLTSVTIPDSVKTISDWAFADCTSLTSITIPDSVTTIAEDAFSECESLTSVAIGSGVTTIGEGMFSASAFDECVNLASITVSANNQYYSSNSDGVLFNKEKTTLVQYPMGKTRTNYTIPDGVTTIGCYAFKNCDNLTSVTISDSVTTIDDHVFEDCDNLASVTIGNSVTTINRYVFYSCDSLTSITIPDNVTTIGDGVFSYCYNLENVTIGNNVTSIGAEAFYYCYNLKSVIIPNSVTTIGEGAFASCQRLESVTIGENVTNIGDYAFYCCYALMDVYYTGSNVQWNKLSIGKNNEALLNAHIHFTPNFIVPGTCGDDLRWTFDNGTGVLNITGTGDMYEYTEISSIPWYSYRYDIEKIMIDSQVESVSAVALACCTNLTSIYVDPDSKYFSNDAVGALFNKAQTVLLKYPAGNERTIYIIPETVSVIGEYAFAQMKHLSVVGIPESVTNIGEFAFSSSSNIFKIYAGSESQFESINGLENSGIYEGKLQFGINFGLLTIELNYDGDFSTSENLPHYVEFPITDPVEERDVTLTKEDFVSTYTDVLIYKLDFPEGDFYIVPDSVVYVDSYGKETPLPVTVKIGSFSAQYFKCTIKSVKSEPNVDGTCGDNLTWNLNTSTGALTITGTGDMYDYDYYGKVYAPWYVYKNNISSICFGDGVTSIGKSAFTDCDNISDVTIGKAIESIGDYAFDFCDGLVNVSIPASLTDIGWSAFGYCPNLTGFAVDSKNHCYSSDEYGVLFNKDKTILLRYPDGNTITSYEIPFGVKTIKSVSFYYPRYLESITVPNTVTLIESQAFCNCTKLSEVNYIGTNEAWNTITINDGNDCLVNANINFVSGSVIASGACGESLTWSLYANGLLKITGTGEMWNYYYNPTDNSDPAPWLSNSSDIKTVIIDNGVTSIGNYAFAYCVNLTSVTIGNSVTSIGESAFCFCDSLTSVTIPDSVTTICWGAFEYCYSLTSITIPDSVTSIGNYAFFSCDSLTNITVDVNNKYYLSNNDGVLFNKDKTTLIQYPIGKTGTSYTIPDSVTTIGSYAFSTCDSLTSVTIPDSVTSIGNYAFYGCDSLTSITIPDSVTTIGSSAFSACHNLTSVTIPDSVTSIGDYAFYYCTSLTSVTIPDSVTTIGDYAFYSCTSLTSVTIPDSVTTIGYGAFEYCYSLTSITIPDSVTTISGYAFRECDSLTNITVDANNKYYSSDSYGVLFNKDKTTLIQYPIGKTGTSYIIPDSVTTIGSYAFSTCDSLTSVTIPDSVTTINGWAFSNCYSLTSVTIPDSVTSIGNYAFAYCDSLTSVTIPDSVTTIGYGAFEGCDSLTSVTIPDGVTTINGWAFSNCHSLTSVTIPDSVTTIGDYAFYSCYNLNDVYYDSTEEMWNTISIGERNEALTSVAIHFNECEHPENQLSWETVKDATCAPGLEIATCGVCGKRGGKKTVVCDSSTYPESEHNYADGINQTWNFSYPGAKKLILKFSDLTETESCCDYIYLYDSNGCYIGLYFGTYLSGETIEIEGSGFSIELISDYSVNYYGFSFDSISAVVDNDLNRVIPAVSEHDWSNKDGVCANGCGTECTHPDGTQGACDACGYSCAVSGHIIRSDRKCSLCGKIGGTCYENLTWIFDEVTGELNISGTGELYYYDNYYADAPWYEYYSSIKTIIIGDGVTGIPDFAFYNYYNLTNVTIGNGVATIGAYAFSECHNLKSVTIPDSVTTIGDYAFEYCIRLASVTIGNNVTSIGKYAFHDCYKLTSVTIPDSVTTIGDYAFKYCSNLTNVTLGKGLTQIGTRIFVGCNVLSEINVNEANKNYCSVDGVLYNKNKTVIVAYPSGKMDKEFTIPDTVKEIGTYSFAGCNNLQTLYIPESVTTIGAYAFEDCYNLNIVFSSNEFTSIGDYAFAGCTFTSFVIPEGVESIGNYAFAYCYSLEEIVIPDSVTAIGENAFEWCSSLKTIDIPDSVKTIGSYAFYECYSLETVKLGNGIDEIPQSMFGYCYALKEIEIPNGVTSIGTGAFYYCENLNTVIIPESVSTIDAEAFAVCKSLKSFEVSAENDKFCSENGVLFNKDKTKIISYPAGKTDKTYIIPSSVTSIESYAFSASKNLYYITIPSTVTSIGEYAFAYSNLVSLFLEDGITKVTSYSFTHCEKLASVTIPATVTLIEDNAFNCCRSLKEIYYYGSEGDWQAVEIGSNNFLANAKMYYLDSAADNDYVFANGELIVNGPEIVSIKFADMDFADEIVKVTVKSGVSKILPFVFADLPNLTEVNISKSVFYIGDFAFENCVNLEALNLDAEFDDETVEEESSGYIEEPWGEISDTDIGLMEEAPDAIPTLPPVSATTIPYTEYPSSPEESTVREEEYSEYTTIIFDDRPTKPATTNPQPSEEEYSSDNRLIGIMAFAGCANLENIVVPGTFKTVGNYAFADCTKLADVTLEDGIETIGCAAFNNCTSLSEIAIPESTKKLGYDAFYGCSSLETVYYNAIDCYLFGASESALIAFGERESIKNFIFGNKVETIPSYLLRENTGITEIDIPDSVTTISSYAFYDCRTLTSVTIGNSVTTIGNYAFEYCSNLTSVTIGNSVTTIGGCAFCGCTSLTSIKIPDSVTAIGWGAFSSCDNLESITVDAKNEYYSSDSCGVLFNKDKTDLIQYPAGNKRLSYDIPETVVTIYDEAFFCCENLINVTIPDGVTDIYSYAFANCTRLKSIALPDGLTEISWCAFFNCSNLTSVAIPESVTDIYYAAFSECYSLSDVYYSGSEEQWEEIYITADNTPLLSANIHFNSEPPEPDKIIASGICGESLNWVLYDDGILEISSKGAMHDFEDGTEPWYGFKNTILQVIVEDGVTTIGDGAFFDCPNLKSVTLGADITSIGFEAFKCCGNITDVYYNGTTEQWNSISIDKYNEDLTNAALHFKPQQQTSNCKISIKRPDVKNVNYGDTLMFEAVVNNLPQGAKIVWKLSGDASAKLKVVSDGMSCTVKVTGAGELKITASVVSEQGVPYKNANGNNISSHKTFTAKAGFWEFIIWIFKSIFGTTPVYPPETLL